MIATRLITVEEGLRHAKHMIALTKAAERRQRQGLRRPVDIANYCGLVSAARRVSLWLLRSRVVSPPANEHHALN